MFKNLRADFAHYKRYCFNQDPAWIFILRVIICHPASIGIVWYRFGKAGRSSSIPILRHFLQLTWLITFPLARLYSGVQISLEASVGPGLTILHFGGVVVAPGTIIGKNCLLHHNVNLVTYRNSKGPKIGENFSAGVGAIVIDNVVIEDNVTAGAGTVITRSIPEGAFVAGVPARILRFRKPGEEPSENKGLGKKKGGWVRSSKEKFPV